MHAQCAHIQLQQTKGREQFILCSRKFSTRKFHNQSLDPYLIFFEKRRTEINTVKKVGTQGTKMITR